jgi:hypothetical protein
MNQLGLMAELTGVNLNKLASVCVPLNVALERQGQDCILCGPILEDVLSAFQLVLKVIDQKSSSILYAAENESAFARAETLSPARGKEEQQERISESDKTTKRLASGSESLEVSSHGVENTSRSTAIFRESRQTQTDEHELQQTAAGLSETELLRIQCEMEDAPLAEFDEIDSEEENAFKDKTKEDQRRQHAESARLRRV